MKIAFVTEFSQIGGGESNLLSLAKELSKTNDVCVFCPKGPLFNYLTDSHIKVFELRYRLKKRWIKFIPFLSYNFILIRELNKYDLVHAYSLNVLPLLFLIEPPLVWTTHGYWEKPYGLRARIINLFTQKIVAVSSDVYQLAEFPKSKKHLVFLGTVIPLAKPRSKDFDPSHFTFCCIGRFQKIKGQDLLLDAIIDLSNNLRTTTIDLFIVGDVNGKSQEDFEYKRFLIEKSQRVYQNNINIYFEGFRKNTAQYVYKSDAIIVPSRYESFSMVCVEALACGKPVVAPNIGGPKEIINSSRIGILFNPGDKNSLIKAMNTVVNNYSSFDAKECQKRAADFSIFHQAVNHLMLYKEALDV